MATETIVYIGWRQARLDKPTKKLPTLRPTGPGGVRSDGSFDDQERGSSVELIIPAIVEILARTEESVAIERIRRG